MAWDESIGQRDWRFMAIVRDGYTGSDMKTIEEALDDAVKEYLNYRDECRRKLEKQAEK